MIDARDRYHRRRVEAAEEIRPVGKEIGEELLLRLIKKLPRRTGHVAQSANLRNSSSFRPSMALDTHFPAGMATFMYKGMHRAMKNGLACWRGNDRGFPVHLLFRLADRNNLTIADQLQRVRQPIT